MTAVAKLPEKWREHAAQIGAHTTAPHGLTWDHGACDALNRCADELEAALSPAELGGVEVSEAVETLRHKLANDEDGWRALCAVMGAIAYTTPRAAEAVTEEMVERALSSYYRNWSTWKQAVELGGDLSGAMRAALTAALKGEL